MSDRATLTVVRRWELWEGEGETAFFPATSEKNRLMARSQASLRHGRQRHPASDEAMQALYDHLDIGSYQPPLREDGTATPRMRTTTSEESTIPCSQRGLVVSGGRRDCQCAWGARPRCGRSHRRL